MNVWRRQSSLRDAIVAFVCYCLVMVPFTATLGVAQADEIIDEANKGQDTAANLLLNYQVPTINDGPPGAPIGPNELPSQDLFPGYDPADPSQHSTLSDLANNPSDLSTQGVAQQFTLQAGSDETAEAYQSVDAGSVNPNYATIDMRTDDFLDRSREIISGNDPILDEILTACAEDVTAGDPGTDTVTRLEDVWTCSQLRTGQTGSCTVERDFVLSPVATQIVLSVVGASCSAGSGNDISDHTGDGLIAYTYASDPLNTDRCEYLEGGSIGAPPPLANAPQGTEWWISTSGDDGAGVYDRDWQYALYCGEFDSGPPAAPDCNSVASTEEWRCRHTDFTDATIDGNAAWGAVGSCSSYADPFNQTGAVDYSDCDIDRQTYCTQVKDQVAIECKGNTCGGLCGSGLDRSDHSGWGTFVGTDPPACFRTQPGASHQPWDGTTFYPEAFIQLDNAALPGFPGWLSTNFCGEFDTYTPTSGECAGSANILEHICRNAPGNTGGPGHSGQLNSQIGVIGSCSAYNFDPDGSDYASAGAVDYTGCTPERQTYCEARRQEFESECGGACANCESQDNIAIYNPLSYFGNAGQVNSCHTFRLVYNYSPAPGPSVLGGAPKDFSYMVRIPIDPGDYDVQGWSTDACGESPNPDCVASADAFEARCNGSQGWPVVDDQNNATTPAYCAAERATYEANCVAANSCVGSSGSAPLLNGTETIVSPGIGPGFVEVLADQALFGSTVDLQETAFNPGDYGLAAGEYVIADHAVIGAEITASTIDDGGSYGGNWDYTFTATAVDSPGFEVEATLYEIVSNNFIFTGCSQADVQNVDNGTCSGSITCTDYTPPCRTVDGVLLCEDPSYTYGITQVLTPWSDFTSTIPEMCWFADVDIEDCVGETNCIGNPACVNDCASLPPALQPACEADPCWVDAQGNTICLDDTSESWVNNLGDPNFVDDCGDLLGRPECTLLPDIACVEGMEDDSDPTNIDLCNLRQRFFDCGTDVTVPGIPGADDVDVTCGAEIRCFGDECSNTTAESNPDFVRAAVAATTVTESTKDMECDVQGDPLSCRIFDGTDNRCKDPRGSYLGIIPDCCDESRQAGASGGDFITYMQLARHSYRLARDPIIASWLSQRQILPSGLQNVVNAPAQIGRTAGRAVVSGFNSALEWAGLSPIDIATDTEATQTLVGASPTGFGPVQQFIAGGVDNFLRSIGADTFADSLFTTTPEGAVTDWAADGLGQMVGDVLQVIGLIYTIYNILRILGSIFFACEEEELAFGIQQVNRACHHVGTYCSKKVSFLGFKKCIIETQTYCCFSSPFARIINQQLRLQGIGPEWGTATEPNCEGIAISELENVDWALVDLSEWEAIMFEAGLVPDPRNPPLNFIPTDLHPGDSTGGNEGATSTDIMQDTINIVMPDMAEGRFGLYAQGLNQPDPDLMPWYDDGNP